MRMVRFRYGGVDYEVARARLSYDPRLRNLLKRSYIYGVNTFFRPTKKKKKVRVVRLKLKKKPRRVARRPKRKWSRARILKSRRITPFEIKQLKKLSSKHGVSTDLLDWKSEVDRSLTYSENRRMLMKKIRMLSPRRDDFLEFNLKGLKGEKRKYLNGLKFRISTGNHTAFKEFKFLEKKGWLL